MNIDTLLSAMPNLSRSKAEVYLAPMEGAMTEYQITSELRSAMWLAQVGHESGSLVYFEEIASGEAYEGRRDLGNTQPGDGKRYKGRGPIQVTGRDNYTRAAGALRLPLVDNPALAADPQHAFRISAWWWQTHGLNEISDQGDVDAATRRINGGLNGIDDRRRRYSLARSLGAAVIPGGAPAGDPPEGTTGAPPFPLGERQYYGPGSVMTGPGLGQWQARMIALGHDLGSSGADGAYGPRTMAAAQALQNSRGLGADGLIGPLTWTAAWA